MKWAHIVDVSVDDIKDKRLIISDTKLTKEELLERCQDIADFYLQYYRVDEIEKAKINFRII